MAPGSTSADQVALGRIEPLSHRERLVLTVVAQRYLRLEADPHPVSRSAAARQLQGLLPDESWSEQQVSRVLNRVTQRSNVRGSGLERGDAGLATVLIAGAVLVPPDLRLLDPANREHR